ncbi:DUF2163 domain-containing protein [Meridianimarinicoccus sp. RP-17]|uniref:DUF2163 domain-containing protein n=1 Tax=Meridianimarinicoccus zhengii TaxID=2056810 RepID=UPI000DAF2AF8|nr:DUF2163 domain-containing protein [Phycocomes zhengii]
MAVSEALAAHLAAGTTTLCRCWAVARRDGVTLGFTDHDNDLVFDGVLFRADSGLTGQALQQTTGLAVDNGEALGALQSDAVTEADLVAGRYDAAEVRAWLVNWTNIAERHLLFRGTIGEVQTGGGGFRAELRGLTESLGQPMGRVYQRHCNARLGDAACAVDMASPAYSAEANVIDAVGGQALRLSGLSSYGADWFARGKLDVLSGAATGLSAMIKSDALDGAERRIDLWQELRATLAAGDRVRVQAGCDKRAETCKAKFGNFSRFRGFPHIPGEDWLMAVPKSGGSNGGGSLNR